MSLSRKNVLTIEDIFDIHGAVLSFPIAAMMRLHALSPIMACYSGHAFSTRALSLAWAIMWPTMIVP